MDPTKAIMYWCRIHLELKEGLEAEIDVAFRCISQGVPGDRFTPTEWPQFDIHEVIVDVVYNNVWAKGQNELGGWYEIVQRAAEEAIENCDIYDDQYDAYRAYLEH